METYQTGKHRTSETPPLRLEGSSGLEVHHLAGTTAPQGRNYPHNMARATRPAIFSFIWAQNSNLSTLEELFDEK
jgi:hypothetical protein